MSFQSEQALRDYAFGQIFRTPIGRTRTVWVASCRCPKKGVVVTRQATGEDIKSGAALPVRPASRRTTELI